MKFLMSITGFLLVRGSGGVEAGAPGGHQEVQGAAAADPAGSPAPPDDPPHDVIDRSRSRRMACLDCWVEFVVPSYCISLVDDWKIIRLVLDFWTIVLDF
jgi:hypothetical protein